MNETKFLQYCDSILNNLCDLVEKYDQNAKLDVEYLDGILTITVEETAQTYVINRHSASQKIWYSSPLTGAHYFVFNQQKQQWFNGNGIELEAQLFLELKNFI